MNFADEISDINKLSHAYALEGAETEKNLLIAHMRTLNYTENNPDILIRTYESFGIDESRDIVRHASRKPLAMQRTILIIFTPAVTAEAQNALLKTFEDPAADVTFFLIIPNMSALLPTLQSRLQLLRNINKGEQEEGVLSAKDFLLSSPAKRISLLEPLIKEKSLANLRSFLSSIERAIVSNGLDQKDSREGLRAVYRAQKYLGDKGSLTKVLLEQVALLTPRTVL